MDIHLSVDPIKRGRRGTSRSADAPSLYPEAVALEVVDLSVTAAATSRHLVRGIAFSVPTGTTLALVGESGSGKTTVALSLLGYARPGTAITGGKVAIRGRDILSLRRAQLQEVRGHMISYVAQNPAKALSPGMRIGRQVDEVLEVMGGLSAHDRNVRIREAFDTAQLPSDKAFLRRFPHELSGGQKQRAAIAMAFVCKPQVLVMDEPTTGLDVITQSRLIDVIRDLASQHDVTIIYVSHDLAVVGKLAQRVAVMYAGEIVEETSTEHLFRNPRHPYSNCLLDAIPQSRQASSRRPNFATGSESTREAVGCPFAPRCSWMIERCTEKRPPLESAPGGLVRCLRWQDVAAAQRIASAENTTAPVAAVGTAPLLRVIDLRAGYGGRASRNDEQRATLKGISLEVKPGLCLAIIGESGSGKTTLARCLAGLHAPFNGEIWLGAERLAAYASQRRRELRREIQMVFQDPDSSLNPSMTVSQSIVRSLRLFERFSRRTADAQVAELLERVALDSTIANRLPRELSGGEKQRVAIARAIAAEPQLLICDEVTSALDVIVQASILDLLQELRESMGMTVLFISHDLSVVKGVSDEVAILQNGSIVESGSTDHVFANPVSEYTRELLLAAPAFSGGGASDRPIALC